MSATGWVITVYAMGPAILLAYAARIWLATRTLDRSTPPRRNQP